MLKQSQGLAKTYAGKKSRWQQHFSEPKTTKVLNTTSVWLNLYQHSLILPKDTKYLYFLGSEDVLTNLEKIGLSCLCFAAIGIGLGVLESYQARGISEIFQGALIGNGVGLPVGASAKFVDIYFLGSK